MRNNHTYADRDKCLISLGNQSENQLPCYILRVEISTDFAWVAYSSLGGAGREKPEVNGDFQAHLLSSFMERYGQLL